MSGTAIFVGRIASIQGGNVDTRNGSIHKATIQVITEKSYKDRNGTWVNQTSSFFVTEWGERGRAIVQNNTLEVGFGVYLECEITNTKGNDGKYYTDYTLNQFKITSRPKAWHDRRNNVRDVAPQNIQQTLPLNTNTLPEDDIPF